MNSKDSCLADASPLVRKAVEAALPASEFELRTAPDGLAAIRILPEFSPDAVLVALTLPGMDGYEVAAFLRSQPVYRAAALFLLRGSFEIARHGQAVRDRARRPDPEAVRRGDAPRAVIRSAIDRKKELPSLPEDPFFEAAKASAVESRRRNRAVPEPPRHREPPRMDRRRRTENPRRRSARRSSATRPRWRTGPGISSRPSSRKFWSRSSRPSTARTVRPETRNELHAIHRLATCVSTNDEAKDRAREGAPEGTVDRRRGADRRAGDQGPELVFAPRRSGSTSP